ncbi:hypothetical protein FNP_1763 [Fusobacterium polymorphum ATCC 10953]|uniref:Uncharacterized protein n=1 Tax=Fusobacterium polymorphum ATCC 10953 TaxID=393480 RepID=A5TXB0_FUSNP|nr:hypothetical protein FNP_1763 [Fusobacterium polymorphum ATCC 10953]
MSTVFIYFLSQVEGKKEKGIQFLEYLILYFKN